MTDKSLSLLDKIVNHTGKTARQLELITEYLTKNHTSQGGAGSGGNSSGPGSVTNNIKNITKNDLSGAESLGKSMTAISGAVLKFALVPNFAKKGFIKFIENFVDVVKTGGTQANGKKTEILINAIAAVSTSSSGLTAGIKEFSTISKKKKEEFLSFILDFATTINQAAKKIGKKETDFLNTFDNTIKNESSIFKNLKIEDIEKGAQALKAMSVAILGFAASFVIAAPLIIIAGILAVPMLAVIAGISFIFYEMGKYQKEIKKGGRALVDVSIGMAALSLGLLAITLVTMVNPVATLGGIALIALTGLVFAILGEVSSILTDGAEAIGWISLSIIVFTGSLWLWQKAKITMADSMILAGTVVALGVVWSLAGAAIEFIVPGAIAIAAIGVSAWLLGFGLSKVLSLNLDRKKVDEFSSAATGLIKPFMLAGLAAPFIMLGSLAYGAMGLALLSLAAGVGAISKIDLNNFDPKKLAQIISGISGAFAIAGSSDGQSGNLLSWLTGVELGPNNVKRGIDSVLDAGAALTSISQGLKNFQRDTAGIEFEGKNSITTKIAQVTTTISRVFAGIGKSANAGDSLWKEIFGTDWRKSDVQNGITSVMGTGAALTSVAKGLSAFSDLSKLGIKKDDFDPNKTGSLIWNITKVIGSIDFVFSNIGKSANGGTSIWKACFGADWEQSDVEAGIDSVKGAGSELSSIANSLKDWKSLDKLGLKNSDFNVNFTKNGALIPGGLMSNVYMILNSVRASFAMIGKSEKDTESKHLGITFNEGDVRKGIEAVKGAGEELTSIANSLTGFSKISGDQYKVIGANIQNVILAIPTAFIRAANLIKGREESIKGLSNFIQGAFTYIGKAIENIKDNFDGKDSKGYIGRLGDDLANLLTQMTDKAKPNTLVNFSKFADVIQTLAKVQDPFDKFTKSFSNFSKDMKSFVESFNKLNAADFEKFNSGLNYTNTNGNGNFSMLNNKTSVPYSNPTGNQVFKPDATINPAPTQTLGDKIEAGVTNAWNTLTGNSKPSPGTTPPPVAAAAAPDASPQQTIDYTLLAAAIVKAMESANIFVSPHDNQAWRAALGQG